MSYNRLGKGGCEIGGVLQDWWEYWNMCEYGCCGGCGLAGGFMDAMGGTNVKSGIMLGRMRSWDDLVSSSRLWC